MANLLVLLLVSFLVASRAFGSPPPIASDPPPLQCFEVSAPVRGPSSPLSNTVRSMGSDDDACTVVLMSHSFGWSYGRPFVADYVPPPQCGDFNRVVVNFTATSVGRQFDRLAIMFLGDTEVWRTSTAEPSPGVPIAWTHWVDMTAYLALWRRPQRLVFDLGNLVDDTYTGVFDTTLTATFFSVEQQDGDDDNAYKPADIIIPITARRSAERKPSHWMHPGAEKPAASVADFPRNVKRAVVSVSANGQLAEEFWWANQLESDKDLFPSERLPGLSPFREVQVLIDGQVAGMQWPFPVVFTGGYAPNMHRPVVGIGVFTLRESEVDVTPWLPLLCDGNEHTIELAVLGVEDDGEGGARLVPVADQYWVLTAKVFMWLHDANTGIAPTGSGGGVPAVVFPDAELRYHSTLTRNATHHPEALLYNVSVRRQIHVSGEVGGVVTRWSQNVLFAGSGHIKPYTGYQTASVNLSGESSASGSTPYVVRYSYPISLLYSPSSGDQHDETIIAVDLRQARIAHVHGQSAYPPESDAFYPNGAQQRHASGYTSVMRRNGTAIIVRKHGQPGVVRRAAATRQQLRLSGLTESGPEELYARKVEAANDAVKSDVEVIRGRPETFKSWDDMDDDVLELVEGLESDFAPERGGLGASRAWANDGQEMSSSSPVSGGNRLQQEQQERVIEGPSLAEL